MDRLKARFFWLDSHHRIERFGVFFITLSLIMMVITVIAALGSNKMNNENFDGQVMYTNTFTASLSGVTGSVQDIFRSSDNTQVFMLLKFDDPTKISTNAENYRLFLTGSNKSMTSSATPLCNPSATVYMFGSTGYMGIYLLDNGGFDKQILDLVVRCNVVMASEGAGATDLDDASFSKYDQFRIYFNPGGSYTTLDANPEYAALGYTPGEFLDAGNVDAYTIYEECVVRNREQELRTLLDTNLKDMQVQLTRISEYTQTLYDSGIQVSDPPQIIAGDQVLTDEDGNLYLDTDTTCARGFNFDWRAGSIHEGYLDELSGNLSYTQFMMSKQNEVDLMPFDLSNLQWFRTDGSLFDDESGTDMDKNIGNTINLLTSAWSSYYTLKQTYQCTNLRDLLLAEINAYDVADYYTSNKGNAETPVITVY